MSDEKEIIKTLERKVSDLEQELLICIEIIEKSGVDYDEAIESYTED